MTGAVLAAGVLALLVAGGWAGPRLLDRLSLASHPRIGIAVWSGAVAVWLLGLLALGPLLAWSLTGPSLPGSVGAVCRRCLEASSPFGAAVLPVGVPPAAALGLSALVAAGLLAAMTTTYLGSRREVAAERAALGRCARTTTLAGTPVWLVRSAQPLAYALPGRGPGIAVSEGAVALLSREQLGAVLAHEAAHRRERHHLILGLLRAARTVLGVVPLVGTAPAVVGAFAEMAADDAARRTHGTRALAGALLALHAAGATVESATALHAAGVEVSPRVRRLAGASAPRSRLAMAVVGGYLMGLTGVVAIVVGPSLAVLAGGVC